MLPVTAPRWGSIQYRHPCSRGSAAGTTKHSGCHGYCGTRKSRVSASGAPGARGKGEGTGEDKGTRGEKGEGRAGMWGWPGRAGKAQRVGMAGAERGERDMEGKGRLGGYRKGEAWGPLRDPRSLGPLTRQPGRQAPPSPVATRRRQHPAGEDHALGVRGGRPLCHLCALETQNI